MKHQDLCCRNIHPCFITHHLLQAESLLMFEAVQDWFLGLGAEYGVNPVIFGAIYVGAIPFFSLCVAWLIRNYRQKKSIVLPALGASFFFISAYLYLLIAGHNIPVWVYFFVAGMILFGIWSTVKKIRTGIAEEQDDRPGQANRRGEH